VCVCVCACVCVCVDLRLRARRGQESQGGYLSRQVAFLLLVTGGRELSLSERRRQPHNVNAKVMSL
jgi:hypothetical protein